MPNTLYDALIGARPDDAPLLILPDGTVFDTSAMDTRAAGLSAVLAARGIGPGDRVAVQVEKSAEALALYLACLRAGAVFVPLNSAYTPDEMAYFIQDCAPGVLVCDPGAADALDSAAQEAGAQVLTLDASGRGSLTAHRTGAAPAAAQRGPDDLACFLYTSGTTGRSKGAMLSHANLLSNAQVLAQTWRFTPADTLLHVLPIFHAHGLFVACNTVLLSGGAMIWQPGFDADAALAALPRATAMMGVPTHYTRLLAHPGLTQERCAHMRLFTSGSAPLLAETHAEFAARTGHAILERYGMTETGMIASNPYTGERRPGTVGFPLDGVSVRVTDAGGAACPDGETGVIELKGPNVFKGYWRKPEKTAEDVRPDGFFVTGDLGRFDADGYLHIVGREKDLVISGGFNVYPKEVESVLDAQPGVLESAVIGVPHPDFGEGVVAVIVPRPGGRPAEAALRDVARASLANYKRPKAYVFVDALPRNTMGKVQKAALRRTHAAHFARPDKQEAAE